MTTDEPAEWERPRRFDAFGLVTRRGEIAGEVDAYDLERVHDRLGDDDGVVPPARVAYRITGKIDPMGRPVLCVGLAGGLPLQCQRCLRLFEWPLRQETTVLLARDEEQLAWLDENDEREVVLAAEALNATALVEDELLLAIPFAPRCDRPDCRASGADAGPQEEAGASSGAFAALASMRQQKDGNKS